MCAYSRSRALSSPDEGGFAKPPSSGEERALDREYAHMKFNSCLQTKLRLGQRVACSLILSQVSASKALPKGTSSGSTRSSQSETTYGRSLARLRQVRVKKPATQNTISLPCI